MARSNALAAALLAFASTGCGVPLWGRPELSTEMSFEHASAPAVTSAAGLAEVTETKPPAPLEASVAQAFFVGGTLHIKVRVSALGSLSSDNIVVGVLGLREGQVVETQYARLLEIINERTFTRGKSAILSFELKAENLTEYQVRCSWGDEALQLWSQYSSEHPNEAQPKTEVAEKVVAAESARALAPTKPPDPTPSDAQLPSIEDVELEETARECDHPPCDLFYTLRARVVNNTPYPLESVRLAVGISWSESKNLPKSPKHGLALQSGEEVVELKGAVLQTGQGKKLKVKVARAVPVVPGGAFLPYIRLVESKIAKSP